MSFAVNIWLYLPLVVVRGGSRCVGEEGSGKDLGQIQV